MSFRKKLFVFFCVFFLIVCSVFVFRGAILNHVLQKVKQVVKDRYNMQLTINNSGITGIRNIYIEGLHMVAANGDTLVKIEKAEAKVNIPKLLTFNLAFLELRADSVFVTAIKNDSTDNYSMFFKGRQKKETPVVAATTTGLNERLASIAEKVNNLFNEKITLRYVRISYAKNGLIEQLSIPELFYDKKEMKGTIVTLASDGLASYRLQGKANALSTNYDFILYRTSKESGSWPFINSYDNLKVTCDTVHVSIEAGIKESVVPFKCRLNFSNLAVNHWRISPVNVLFPYLDLQLNALVDENRFSFNKGTSVKLSQIPLYIEGYYERKPEIRYVVNAGFQTTANNFFESLPKGMFSTLQGMKAKGNLNYSLAFDLNKNDPDKVIFNSALKREHFRIERFGDEYFPLINEEFQFMAMDKERPMRRIAVGGSNPFFTAYADISNYLKYAVLSSEDPSFFNHNGFVEEAFRESIATNVKQGRFARGGSTISMQLVKNLFLSRNKTISRKLEEVLIVWLIEQNRLVSKERMFEVYLNIIEWGPDVYGVGEASRFYFSKLPRELNLSESIFLSSIIPHPKYFKYMFDSTGTLKENQKNYFQLIGNRLLKREQITQQDFDMMNPAVKLNGAALEMILPAEPAPVDSLEERGTILDVE